jgi:hypothetical protein
MTRTVAENQEIIAEALEREPAVRSTYLSGVYTDTSLHNEVELNRISSAVGISEEKSTVAPQEIHNGQLRLSLADYSRNVGLCL